MGVTNAIWVAGQTQEVTQAVYLQPVQSTLCISAGRQVGPTEMTLVFLVGGVRELWPFLVALFGCVSLSPASGSS